MSNSSQRRGFTLIEILVVIAIIGILMAILVPVLNKARETAYKGKCAANLKSLCFALNDYAQDEDAIAEFKKTSATPSPRSASSKAGRP